ncbi:MarR family winged helix-turn-helix transcriptional regulator [Pseudomonas aeruginosa]|uniref:MarR family winged helix-turn-helix transcriptional regulator n=1 Tax=Pseudomonas aeruginosa TaxID=287 RepID=UPI0009376900|nr:MarR family winged helix-turn-helix transcriptional regulator [Pseudomonas aeruginosa]HDR3017808.1 winged helix-turn-helix transcriptional regulator [Pseudomonas aeruginosa]
MNLDLCTVALTQNLGRILTQMEDAQLSEVGLTGRQLRLLETAALAGPLPIGGLAALLHLDRSTLSRNIQPLLRAGWLGRSSGRDRRKNLISITEAGSELRERSEPFRQRAEQEIESRLGLENCEALKGVIRQALVSLLRGG